MNDNLKAFLDQKVAQYNRPEFIANDPVSIPHMFSKKQDIEIMGFWAATLAWGQRVTIINKCKELITLMDGAPYDFIINHEEPDLKKLLHFKHRTFNDIDTLYFISFFRWHYENFESLEDAFLPSNKPFVILNDSEGSNSEYILRDAQNDRVNKAEAALNHFRSYFFSLPDFPHRTKKHVSSPSQKSTCKRLNMFLRWMVRKDDNGVDFGIWNKLKPADLICPCDLHVDRVARKLKLITRKQTDWQTALELTHYLRELDPLDPVKYDFALFGLGIEERWGLEGILPEF
ncbi:MULTISPECIES: TIGR02757 family protein [unclassified Mucilaginibacter]|uniref:TIGR02757 family protein n=1 Tax=unclassified Mucilaginibacter TaxID=2617802 RepID=UPI002AC9690B|nr:MULTISPECIES: TIGR02757 family protein [unclassified Mucilaginibacter]MEB0261015.1 TIGR02757 family protein [Mucilaginibacter sp. 10I4]MEB0279609.1 TIGR02757 family protein [Mucilaginibacter sp. 10B2]MEB0300328.1 TIGR02757 family protein [Mucilaginibacter sp. 5C4]WPX22523.1 TIGR02757 family protein [Mucilaginibacter sp. 5C4]